MKRAIKIVAGCLTFGLIVSVTIALLDANLTFWQTAGLLVSVRLGDWVYELIAGETATGGV